MAIKNNSKILYDVAHQTYLSGKDSARMAITISALCAAIVVAIGVMAQQYGLFRWLTDIQFDSLADTSKYEWAGMLYIFALVIAIVPAFIYVWRTVMDKATEMKELLKMSEKKVIEVMTFRYFKQGRREHYSAMWSILIAFVAILISGASLLICVQAFAEYTENYGNYLQQNYSTLQKTTAS